MKRSRIAVALALIGILSIVALHQRTAHASRGSAGAVCTLSQTGCLKSMVLSQAVPSVVVASASAPVPFDAPVTLFITTPMANSCGAECTGNNSPAAATISVALVKFPLPQGLSNPIASGALSSAADTMLLPVSSPAASGFNSYSVPVTLPPGTPPGIYSALATATVTFSDGMTLTATSDQPVSLVQEAQDRPGKPRLGIELLSETFPRVAPGDQSVARYKVTNNDPTETLRLTAFATSKQIATRPEGGNESQGVFSIGDPFGDDFPISFGAAECIPLPNHPYTQQELRQQLKKIKPGRSRTIEVGIRAYGESATGSCSASALRVEGRFSDGAEAKASAAMAVSVDTSVKSKSCGASAGDCNHNGVADADDIANGTSEDRNFNGTPDECEQGAPLISGPVQISESVVEPGQSIHVKVSAEDDRGVTAVLANGVPLGSTDGKLWEGDIPSSAGEGPQTVFAVAEDADHKIATHIGVYETRRFSDSRIEAADTPQTVSPGGVAEFRLRVIGPAFKEVSLTVDGVPPAASGSFSNNLVIATREGTESRLRIATSETTPEGTYGLTVRGSTGNFTLETSAALEAAITLIVKRPAESFDFSLQAFATRDTTSPGGSTQFAAIVTLESGTARDVAMSVEGLPDGARASFTPSALAAATRAGAQTIVTVSTTSSVELGSYPLTIVATAEELRREAFVTLNVEAASFDFSVQAIDTVQITSPGNQAHFEIFARLLSGASEPVGLGVEGLPDGTSGSFSPASVMPGVGPSGNALATLTIDTPTALSPGKYLLTIVATRGVLRREAAVSLIIQSVPPQLPFDFALSTSDSALFLPSCWDFECDYVGYIDIKAVLLSGTAQPVGLAIGGLPEGFAASFSSDQVVPAGDEGSTVTLEIFAVSPPMAFGTYTVTVIGTSGVLTRSVSFQLIVADVAAFARSGQRVAKPKKTGR